MRKLIPWSVVALVLLGLAGCGDDGGDKKQKITLESRKGVVLTTEDNGDRGPSAGDQRTFTQTLTENGNVVGRLDGATSITDRIGGLEQRLGVIQFSLKDGAIIAAGVYGARPGVNVPGVVVTRAITGGTGKYAGARGTVTETAIAGNEIRFVLDFTLPDD